MVKNNSVDWVNSVELVAVFRICGLREMESFMEFIIGISRVFLGVGTLCCLPYILLNISLCIFILTYSKVLSKIF